MEVCIFFDDEDDVYGDRICNNAIASAIVSILVAMMLMVVDLQIPCTNSTVSSYSVFDSICGYTELHIYFSCSYRYS